MKNCIHLVLLLFCIVSFSCSKEIHTTKQTTKYSKGLEALAAKLFARYSNETFFVPLNLDTLPLTSSEKKLLERKIKCPYIHIIYTAKGASFFSSDSVVLFTRVGFPFIGKQHNVVLDMRKTKRDSIPVYEQYMKYYPVAKGIYYIQDYMPSF